MPTSHHQITTHVGHNCPTYQTINKLLFCNSDKSLLRFVPQPTRPAATYPHMENDMSDATNEDLIQALKIAFCYMPKAIEVNKYEYGDRYQTVLGHIQTVRETLLINEVDPEEVYGEINPDTTPNSSY